MAQGIHGDGNISAGRDVYISRAQEAAAKYENIDSIFFGIDAAFSSILNRREIVRKGALETFSSEKLFASLVSIGIPVSIAIEVPNGAIAILRSVAEQDADLLIFDASVLKKSVLQALMGFQFRDDVGNADEVTTWCAAYVRKYGGINDYVQVIDNGELVRFDLAYIQSIVIPHSIQKIIGAPSEQDVVEKYKSYLSERVLDRMAREVLKYINGLNLYRIHYRTLHHLINELMLQPPHPWMVNEATRSLVIDYNLERALYHYKEATVRALGNPEILFPSALECVAHSCALILSIHGLMLGVQSKYGLAELTRVCDIKISQKNLALWEYCQLDRLEETLKAQDTTLNGFRSFLSRVSASVEPRTVSKSSLKSAFAHARQLLVVARAALEAEGKAFEVPPAPFAD